MFHPIETLKYMRDGMANVISKIGHPSKDKSANWVWQINPLSAPEALAMYASDWLPRKIVDIIPEDATREWRTWQVKDAQAKKINDAEKALGLRDKVMRAMQLDRLFGGAAIYIGTDDEDVMEPLDVNNIPAGGIKYLRVFSRYDLRAGDLVKNIDDDDFDKPEWYELLRDKDGKQLGLRIHRSRFAFFISNPWPTDWALMRSNPEYSGAGIFSAYDSQIGWGQSVYEPILKAIMNAGSVAENVAALVEEAKVDVVQIPNLISYMSNAKSEEKLIKRFSLANMLKANNALLLLGADEKFDRKQINFAQLTDIMHANLQIAAGAADIPIVRLLQQSPSGLNATGDTDLRIHYDNIKSKQTNILTAGSLKNLDIALVRHALGNYPNDTEYTWDPLWQLSETELAQIGLQKSQAFTQLNGLGLFAPEELRPAVADVLVDDGFLPTLDQHLFTEDEANAVLEEQKQQQLEEQKKALLGPPGAGASEQAQAKPTSTPANGQARSGAFQRDAMGEDESEDWTEFLDGYGDNISYEEINDISPNEKRWSDRPGMGKKVKRLPWWKIEEVLAEAERQQEAIAAGQAQESEVDSEEVAKEIEKITKTIEKLQAAIEKKHAKTEKHIEKVEKKIEKVANKDEEK